MPTNHEYVTSIQNRYKLAYTAVERQRNLILAAQTNVPSVMHYVQGMDLSDYMAGEWAVSYRAQDSYNQRFPIEPELERYRMFGLVVAGSFLALEGLQERHNVETDSLQTPPLYRDMPALRLVMAGETYVPVKLIKPLDTAASFPPAA